MLTQARLKEVLDFDGLCFYWKNKSCGQKRAGGPSHRGYRKICIDRTKHYEHRLVWLWHYGTTPSGVIDHIDGDTSNNSIANLQDVSQAKNTQKQKIKNTNKSGCAGVWWDNARKKWQVKITVNLRQINLGRFSSKIEAIAVRQKAMKHYFGFVTEVAR